jgi:predicted glycosyltransferase involved in capsule biosynthesis
MNDITLIQTYYNEPDELLRQLYEYWDRFYTPLKIILIDDGSQKFPAYDVLRGFKHQDHIDFQLWRVSKDIGFNSHGARNLGAYVAQTNWLLFLDIDYTIPPRDLDYLSKEKLKNHAFYNFKNIQVEFDAAVKGQVFVSPTINQFLIRKDKFWELGGYNESYTRVHWGDREFIANLEKHLRKVTVDVCVTDHRGGRKTVIDNTLGAPIYDNENKILYTPRPDLIDLPQITTKLNFDYERLI